MALIKVCITPTNIPPNWGCQPSQYYGTNFGTSVCVLYTESFAIIIKMFSPSQITLTMSSTSLWCGSNLHHTWSLLKRNKMINLLRWACSIGIFDWFGGCSSPSPPPTLLTSRTQLCDLLHNIPYGDTVSDILTNASKGFLQPPLGLLTAYEFEG